MLPPRSNVENINNYFHLPISMNKDKMELNENIVTDLELKTTYDASNVPIFHCVFEPKTIFGKKIIEQYTSFYTTDVEYLKDTQTLYKNFKNEKQENVLEKVDYSSIMKSWDEIKNDDNFKDKYHYLEWNNTICNKLNMSSEFLQLMSLYNISSPLMTLLMPIFILIIPFFVIQLKGLHLTISQYIEVLKHIARNNAIGQLFTQYNSVTSDKKLYLIISAFFYLFSIYQNVLTCIRFHKNLTRIHYFFDKFCKYIEHTEKNVERFLSHSKLLPKYHKFNQIVVNQLSILTPLKTQLQLIRPYELSINKINESFNKIVELGKIMKLFYEIYSSDELNNAFMWSFGMNGYIDTIEGVVDNIKNKYMSFSSFEKKKKSKSKKNKKNIVLKDSYYAILKENNPIKNTVHLDKNLIITGPNASGKTTVLKSSLINIILTQQLGCGFYSSANIVPYKYIHCYLNIPDTSGRDSLFQAEARRCKDILDVIQENVNDTHFCVFDELYSGTNPEEAVSSATSFMKYLVKNTGVNCMLTTHFTDLCRDLDKHKQFLNCHMETQSTDDENKSFIYTYYLKDGISTVRGGIKVLRDMNYPQEILNGHNTK
jgi:hypothetical protein